jgi:uncharacterized protein
MTQIDPAAIGLALAQDPILRFTIQYLKDSGFTLPQHGIAAREWCEEQARMGVVEAQVACGEMLNLGLFGNEDLATGRSWFQRAADRGHPAALLMLANLVETGSDEEPADVERAVSLIRTAAAQDFGPAVTQLGIMHLEGINVAADRDRALKYLRTAADLGDPQGQYILGANLAKELNDAVIREGVGWIEVAAANGFAGAHRHLGYLYRNGDKGLRQDQEKSQRHFFEASQIEENASADLSM